MEVIAYNKLVTDFEALECLRNRKRDRDACEEEKNLPDDGSEPYSAELAAEDYLTATPAGQQTRDSVSACWKALSEHPQFCRLTAPEKLQIINHRPLQPVAVHLMIEDCHRRFREDELIDQLIVLLEQHMEVHHHLQRDWCEQNLGWEPALGVTGEVLVEGAICSSVSSISLAFAAPTEPSILHALSSPDLTHVGPRAIERSMILFELRAIESGRSASWSMVLSCAGN